MTTPQLTEDKIKIDAAANSNPVDNGSAKATCTQAPAGPKNKNQTLGEADISMDDIDTGSGPHENGTGGPTQAKEEYRYSSSSTSQPGSRGSSGNTEYGEGEIDDFPYDDEFEDEDKSFVSDLRGGGKGIRSARTSISSLPGSVVVFPSNKPAGSGQLARGDYRQNINTNASDRNPMFESPLSGGRVRSKKNIAKDGRYSYAPHVRDLDSPFRHPSSVRAMQMGDEDYYDDGCMDDGNYFSSPPSRNGRMGGRQHGSPRMSDVSFRSRPMSPSDQRSYHASPPQPIQPSKEYALILLHCTLLPPCFPLSLPPGLPPPSKELLKEILPDAYWTRWKLLEEKIGSTGLLRDRGILISHPQEAYDLLEERLLETLGLTRPRLAYGHFIGGEDDTDEDEQVTEDEDESNDTETGCVRHKCQDCGQKVIKNRDGVEKKWEVRVYAANGLMGQGAWSAAWKEMEKVDVEVGLCLPTKLRNELEQKLAQEMVKPEAKVKDFPLQESKASDIPSARLQSQIDGLDEPPQAKPTAKSPARERGRIASTPKSTQYSRDDVNLWKALFNYIRIVCRGNQLPIMTVFLVLLALLTPSPYHLFGHSPDVTIPQPDTISLDQAPIMPMPTSQAEAVSQPPVSSEEIVESSLPVIQGLPTASYSEASSLETVSAQLDSSASHPRFQEQKPSSDLDLLLDENPSAETIVSTQSGLPVSGYQQPKDTMIPSQSNEPASPVPPASPDYPTQQDQPSPSPIPSSSSYATSSASPSLPPVGNGEQPVDTQDFLHSSVSQGHAPISTDGAVPKVEVTRDETFESVPVPPQSTPAPTSAAMEKGNELPFLSPHEKVVHADSEPSTDEEDQ
ncbi:TPA_exp: Uncharacterized protein A8136_3356 [Trichophyton benhamiae CBS 112371]|uniref:Pathway-specific nitrogen regulator n=1 Tax=Arthroderma benhamiae (strain ATCC MYA-4681 / CBS 112371) TaxID=663331 RepID=D4B062_ARTBC|nr:uncharacterized protein ARB_01833 [Trichophyton benhamiae CBS 112371]EFE31214.1 conserved hypothetical protein [Trichophyton benhamiae CBS 112371]DAA74389.1 TPA_exp: Uncharacterized protein A8136_3356 [Trichophyton benhamiae CBS 112371]